MACERSETERESCAEFERLVKEEKQAIADYLLALALSGSSTDDSDCLLSSTYATNLFNNRSLSIELPALHRLQARRVEFDRVDYVVW
jgi:hypothetical protein